MALNEPRVFIFPHQLSLTRMSVTPPAPRLAAESALAIAHYNVWGTEDTKPPSRERCDDFSGRFIGNNPRLGISGGFVNRV